MKDITRVRRIAVKAAYGGGGIGLLGALTALVLLGQARYARQVIPVPTEAPPGCEGRYGESRSGIPLRLALLGDSTAAGLGVRRPEETPGALMASHLASMLDRPIELFCPAVVGAVSSDLHRQIDMVLSHRPDIAVIFIGANDITVRTRTVVAVRHLERAVQRLKSQGTTVVVGTCPDFGTIQPIQQPLRWVAHRWSRELAAAQTIAVVRAGGRTVSLGDLLGAEFAAHPEEMFATDRFHPSALGYARAIEAVLPSLVAALGYDEELISRPRPPWVTGEIPQQGLRRLTQAAIDAVGAAGTEVAPAKVTPGRGRWGELRNRLSRLAELIPHGSNAVTETADNNTSSVSSPSS